MSLDAFIHDLQFETEKTTPFDFEVDWDDGPLPYKLYRGLPTFPLSSEIPLTLENQQASVKPDLHQIGHVLWYVCGLTQFSQLVLLSDILDKSMGQVQSARRFIPSGGGLYPSELYIYLKLEDLPTGIYHYDVAHHRLVLLRSGNFDSYLSRSLGTRCDTSACFGIAFVSTMFWKNFFKYHNFSYRLQGLDAGVLIGQFLEVVKRFGYHSRVYFQFLDRSVNHLLGLNENEESVYAVLPLSIEPMMTCLGTEDRLRERVLASELMKELPSVSHDHYIRSRRILEYPMLIKMNQASMIESLQLTPSSVESIKPTIQEKDAVALPPVSRLSYPFLSVCRRRFSPERDFVLQKISRELLAALLHEAVASYIDPKDSEEEENQPEPCVSLYVCIYGVNGIPNGAYRFDSTSHTLHQLRRGDHRLWLQQAMPFANVNLTQVPLCFHVVGRRDFYKKEWGYRGYRIQQMEAGMLVQRLLLAATALGMGGHPLLGFDVNICDEIYRIAETGETSLIQIPVGPHRHRARLEGRLQS